MFYNHSEDPAFISDLSLDDSARVWSDFIWRRLIFDNSFTAG